MRTHPGYTVAYEEGVFRLLLENLRDFAVLILDTQGIVVGWNAGAERLFGYREEEILSAPFSLLLSGDESSLAVERLLATALESGRAEGELSMARKEGNRFPANCTLIRI